MHLNSTKCNIAPIKYPNNHRWLINQKELPEVTLFFGFKKQQVNSIKSINTDAQKETLNIVISGEIL